MVTVNEAVGPGPQPPKAKSPLIIIIGADKGGVGKTTIARALIDYLSKYGVPVRAFDTEPGETGVLKRFYPQADTLNAGSVPGQMQVIDAARGDAVTLVDARAGLLTPMLHSFARIDLFDDLKNGTLRLLVLHVVGSSVASAQEIPGVMAALKDARLVRVNNRVNTEATFAPPLPGEVTIAVPNLDEVAVEAVDRAGVTFAAFAADREQSRVLRGYVRSWLADVHAGFDNAGIGAMLR